MRTADLRLMPANVTFDQHERLIYKFARQVQRRMFAAGAKTIQFEDLVQELSIAWCVARDCWDESVGVPFTPYFVNGMRQRINRFAEGEIKQHLVAPFSIDAPIDPESDKTMEGFRSLEPEPDTVEQRNFHDVVLAVISPEARRFLQILENPPPELLEELKVIQVRAENGRGRGLKSTAPRNLTSALVFDLLGYGRSDRSKILGEIQKVVGKLSELSALSHMPQDKSLMTYSPAEPDAPGCFGSALAYKVDGVECASCPFAGKCGPVAEARLEALRAKLGITALRHSRRRTVVTEEQHAAGAMIAPPPKKVVELLDKIERSGIRVGEAFGRRQNPFLHSFPFLRVAAHLLLRIESGVTKENVRYALMKSLGWSEGTAAAHTTQAFQTFIALGVAEEFQNRLKLKVTHVE